MTNTNVKSPWPGPAGLIPVTSGRADDANLINRAYLDRLMLEMRVIDSVEPDLRTTILGSTFTSPIMMPAFSHLNKVGENGRMPMQEYADAAKNLGLMNWIGMEPNEAFETIMATGAKTGRIIKPFLDHEKILCEIRVAEEAGAIAVGIDIAHIGGADGKYDVVDGIPLGPVTLEDLKSYVASTELPFVAKGVLSVQDALKCKEAGVRAIFISHHHGRIPYGIPPLMVLPEIKKALAGSGIEIYVDCSMDTGYDAYKALALGADAVSVGRGILSPLLKERTKGVENKVRRMNEELSELMIYTGVQDTRSFDPTVIHMA